MTGADRTPVDAGAAVTIRIISPLQPEVQRLLQASDAYLASLYPAESNHLEPAAALAQTHVGFFGVFCGESLAGCGAVRAMNDDGRYGEVKRMYLDPVLRGRGVSKQLMACIEQHAREQGLSVLRLETGIRQPEALGLYQRQGFQFRPPYGKYQLDPLSVFMEKTLA